MTTKTPLTDDQVEALTEALLLWREHIASYTQLLASRRRGRSVACAVSGLHMREVYKELRDAARRRSFAVLALLDGRRPPDFAEEWESEDDDPFHDLGEVAS